MVPKDKEEGVKVRVSRIVDLSHPLTPGREGRRFEIRTIGSDEVEPRAVRLPGQWYIMHYIDMVSHIGTHIEAPYHILENGQSLADIPLDSLLGEAIILDLRGIEAKAEISLEQVQRAAEAAGGLQRGDIVFCQLGWDQYYGTEQYMNAPHFSPASMAWLMERGAKLIGVDSPGLEAPGSQSHPNHYILANNGVSQIENLTGLDKLTKRRVMVFALPIAVRGLDAFPLRVVAVE